jgi:hypothetical protein
MRFIGYDRFAEGVYCTHPRPSEKGYPAVMDGGVFLTFVHLMECHNHEFAYTSHTEISEGVFLVGNTWVDEECRGMGLHEEILKVRNEWLAEHHNNCDIYTLLNPQDTTKIHQLRHVVSKLNYRTKRLWTAKGIPLRVRFQIWRSGLELWGKTLDS